MSSAIRKLLTASAACAALLAASAAQAQDVKLGFLGGFTGPIESLVPPIHEGAKLAVQQINDQGGILDGRKLVLVQGDSTCADTTAASAAADRMVNSEKVTALVGPLCSGETIAAANTAAIPGGVVLVSPAATSPALTDLNDNDLVFRTTPSDAYSGETLAKLLRARDHENIAITYVNNDYGKGFADAVASQFEALGGTVAASEAHEDGKADYRAEIGSLSSSGAEMLVVLAYVDGSGQTIVRQALEGGDFDTFAGGDGMIGDSLVTAVGEGKLDGFIGTKIGASETEGTAIFAEAARAANLDPAGSFVAQSYDAAFLLALAIQKNGSDGREGLSQALRDVATAPGEVVLPGEWEKAIKLIAEGKDINYEGASGSHEFDEKGDVPGVIIETVIEGPGFKDVGPVD
ncbi:ABC transporter substrate-binding protein [Aquamicrobium sp. LC103]|uniref:ABC transporter substrate-binding protein n=1 Tax=Aquamicrobium sp. LC103 TaxID=1120658 RepID=UPI00063ED142|nr:ABC transporter substrate-binding protein [Aquamicrobium sp. LC103]TKT75262.1 amino acid ABC transporter substrate-binding protein [Aquamicrobium sp. LC103]